MHFAASGETDPISTHPVTLFLPWGLGRTEPGGAGAGSAGSGVAQPALAALGGVVIRRGFAGPVLLGIGMIQLGIRPPLHAANSYGSSGAQICSLDISGPRTPFHLYTDRFILPDTAGKKTPLLRNNQAPVRQ